MSKFNLFKNNSSTILSAVTNYIKDATDNESTKLVTTTLRLTEDTKQFYEYLAAEESTSLNTALINTLNKVKRETLEYYSEHYTAINETYNYQLNSLFKILDDNSIDYNDLPNLFEWLKDKPIEREDLTDKKKLANLFDKKTQQRICDLFEYNYDWLQDNRSSINKDSNRSSKRRWYKNIFRFFNTILMQFYLENSITNLELNFLCSDDKFIDNIKNNFYPECDEYITPVLIATRNINGIDFKTYHLFCNDNINYQRCRNYFLLLMKCAYLFEDNKIINMPKFYYIKDQLHHSLLLGKIHISAIYKNKAEYLKEIQNCYFEDIALPDNHFYIDDKDSRETKTPNLLHFLPQELIYELVDISKTDNVEKKLILDDKLFKTKWYHAKSFPHDINKLIKILELYVGTLDNGYKFLSQLYPGQESSATPNIAIETLKRISKNIKSNESLYSY